MWVALLPLLVGAPQFRGLSTEAGQTLGQMYNPVIQPQVVPQPLQAPMQPQVVRQIPAPQQVVRQIPAPQQVVQRIPMQPQVVRPMQQAVPPPVVQRIPMQMQPAVPQPVGPIPMQPAAPQPVGPMPMQPVAPPPKTRPTEDGTDDTMKEVKKMVQGGLVANSQQMSSLNKIYKEVHEMRKGYDSYNETILKCRRDLADAKGTYKDNLEEQQFMDSPASFIQMEDFNSAMKSLEETRQTLEKLAAML